MNDDGRYTVGGGLPGAATVGGSLGHRLLHEIIDPASWPCSICGHMEQAGLGPTGPESQDEGG